MKTRTEKIIEFLKSNGFIEINSKSRKYRTLLFSGNRYYVGKAGAVRKGKTISDSISVTAYIVNRMKKEGVKI